MLLVVLVISLTPRNKLVSFTPRLTKEYFGYFDLLKAYKVYNFRTLVIKETINVKFDDFDQTNRRLSDVECA